MPVAPLMQVVPVVSVQVTGRPRLTTAALSKMVDDSVDRVDPLEDSLTDTDVTGERPGMDGVDGYIASN